MVLMANDSLITQPSLRLHAAIEWNGPKVELQASVLVLVDLWEELDSFHLSLFLPFCAIPAHFNTAQDESESRTGQSQLQARGSQILSALHSPEGGRLFKTQISGPSPQSLILYA